MLFADRGPKGDVTGASIRNRGGAADYDRWFDEPWGRYAFGVEARALRRSAPELTGARVLAGGCGTGRFATALIGDVGRSGREEIDHVPGPAAGAGANFGWPYFEGTQAGLEGGPPGVVAPVLEYPHEERCGVTGGSVYRGSAIPGLAGAFLYSDLCDGIVRAVVVANGAVVAERAFDDAQAGYPVAFGTDLAGELYLCSFDLNAVYRIVAA